ncbi:MAG: tetratricopeptide repeat protein [Bacteroidota bacterium]|jgi:tetratricopeptide (TPR) repeat protein|nr:tetratricopeptide repeat protein [Bacteroidota bacterium]HHU96537.1 tetratricopeptide repeat protein [Petrimonas sp.]
MKIRYIQAIFFFILLGAPLRAQTLDEARGWYLEGRYAEALPVFQQEYQEKPDNAPLNQWVGVCLYETGRILEAKGYLEFASSKKIPEGYLYLGKLLVKLYRFEEAEAEFEKYQKFHRRNNEALDRLEQEREYADKLQRAVNRTEDVQLIDSVVVPKSDFLSAYNLSQAAGSLMPLGQFFKEPVNAGETLHMNERQNKVFFARGDRLGGSTSLFTMEKLLDTFGNEKALPQTINTTGHQAYPFVMSDGLTLYFASTDHQSFGGYDLYVTRYNLATDSYLVPNQLNMPFNSPFNDYMMAIDEQKGIGWFASDRFQPEGQVCIYTFIPNERVTLIEGEEEGYMARRAAITSIRDSWKEGTDYTALRASAQEKVIVEQDVTGEFNFVINDLVTYHSLSDFKDRQAQSIYSQARGLSNQLWELNNELAEQREKYAAGGSDSGSLRIEILRMEREASTLYKEIKRLEIQARNQEIRNIFN